MTAQVHDPRIGLLPPAIPSTCEPRVARDIRTWSLVVRGLRAADRARRLARPPGLADVARAPASEHAADGTPRRTRTGSRSPRPPPRTSDGTRYIYGACPDHGRPRVSPDRVDHDPAAATPGSRGGVDHDPAAKWISTRPPLKVLPYASAIDPDRGVSTAKSLESIRFRPS